MLKRQQRNWINDVWFESRYRLLQLLLVILVMNLRVLVLTAAAILDIDKSNVRQEVDA